MQHSQIDKKLIITVTALAVLTFMGIFSETSLSVAAPVLMKEFNVSAVAVQWLTSGFMLLLASAIPLSPFLIKKFPTKKLFQAAVIIFLTGTITGVCAGNFITLLAGRLIMALGIGCSLPLLTNIVLEEAKPENRGFLFGIVGLIVNCAPVAGPVAGGFITDILNWRWTLLIMIPLLILSFFMGSYSIKDIRKNNTPAPRLSIISVVISTLGLTSFITGLSILAYSLYLGILLTFISIIFLVIFMKLQYYIDYPVINMEVLKYTMFTAGVIAACIPMICVLAQAFLFPITAQNGLLKSPSYTSLLIFPGSLISGVMAVIMGKLYSKYGIRKFAITGYIILNISLLYLIYKDMSDILILTGYTAFLAGSALIFVPMQTNTLNALPADLNADGAAVLNTLLQIAGAIGTTMASVLLSYGIKLNSNIEYSKSVIAGSMYPLVFCLSLTILGLLIALTIRTTLKNT